MNFLYLDFKLYAVLVSIIGTGGEGSQKALKEPLRPNCEPVDSTPPYWYSNSWNQYFLISEFVLGFPLLVLNIMKILCTNARICTQFSIGTQLCIYYIHISEFVLSFPILVLNYAIISVNSEFRIRTWFTITGLTNM